MTDSEETGIVLPSEAESLRQAIYAELDAIGSAEISVGRGYIRLGAMLLRFKQTEGWQTLGYTSMPEFMMELQSRYQRKHTQLYSYLGVAEKLLPIINADTLEDIGITKATELKRALKLADGRPLPPDIIEDAAKPETTRKEVRARLAKAFNLLPDEEGSWLDLDGVFCTPEERKEFAAAVKMTITLLGITPDTADHIQRKAVIFAWLREFTGTHSADVYGEEVESTQATLIVPGTVHA